MLLQIDGKDIILNEGDSIYFDASRPHGMKALDNEKTFLSNYHIITMLERFLEKHCSLLKKILKNFKIKAPKILISVMM